MKRMICLILALLLLSGCSFRQQQNTTAFYYYTDASSNHPNDCLVVPEQRELSSSPSDLKNLLSLYLIGPLDEDLKSPFRGMKLISANLDQDLLTVELFCSDRSLTDARFTLACACLTKTCLELVDVSQVKILFGNRSVTMGQDNLLLEDTVSATTITTEELQ